MQANLRRGCVCQYCLEETDALVCVADELLVCESCAKRLKAIRSEILVPLVVAGLSEFFTDWQSCPVETMTTRKAARRFWAQLACYGDQLDALGVLDAIDVLIREAPRLDATARLKCLWAEHRAEAAT